MDQEHYQIVKKYIDGLPNQYRIKLYREWPFVEEGQKEQYVKKAIQNYLKKFKDQNYLNLNLEHFVTNVDTKLICFNDSFYLEVASMLNNEIYLKPRRIFDEKKCRVFVLNPDTHTYQMDMSHKESIGHVYQYIITNALIFLNHINIHNFLNFIKVANYEYDIYPLDKVREAGYTLIAIRKFRDSLLSDLPLDIVKLIARSVWNSRKDVRGWCQITNMI